MSISGVREIRPRRAGVFNSCAVMIRIHRRDAEIRLGTRSMAYPHNEQIGYSTDPDGSLDGQLANSSELPVLICKPALRRELLPIRRLSFPCHYLNSLH